MQRRTSQRDNVGTPARALPAATRRPAPIARTPIAATQDVTPPCSPREHALSRESVSAGLYGGVGKRNVIILTIFARPHAHLCQPRRWLLENHTHTDLRTQWAADTRPARDPAAIGRTVLAEPRALLDRNIAPLRALGVHRMPTRAPSGLRRSLDFPAPTENSTVKQTLSPTLRPTTEQSKDHRGY